MLDKNGIEIKTGDIVKIEGAFFKNDNGIYFVDRSPKDPSWSGNAYSLKKISKTGRISKSKYSICFWPISVFVNDRFKRKEALEYNSQNATIEIIHIKNMDEVKNHFQELIENLKKSIERYIWRWGEDSEDVKLCKSMMTHYENVLKHIEEDQQ